MLFAETLVVTLPSITYLPYCGALGWSVAVEVRDDLHSFKDTVSIWTRDDVHRCI